MLIERWLSACVAVYPSDLTVPRGAPSPGSPPIRVHAVRRVSGRVAARVTRRSLRSRLPTTTLGHRRATTAEFVDEAHRVLAGDEDPDEDLDIGAGLVRRFEVNVPGYMAASRPSTRGQDG
jgi:hypothetical protein